MKITFVVPELNLTGGLRVVSIYAALLAERGHKVTVVSPGAKKPTYKQRLKSILGWKGYSFNSQFKRTFFEQVDYEVKVLKSHQPVTINDVPDADVIIATFWNTAEWVAEFPESKGKKVYFIQHYEVHPWLPIDKVKATLRLPFKKIVVAQWLADILVDDFQQKNVSLISNAVDHQLFDAPEREKNTDVTFGMMYSNRSYKGSQLALDGFNQLQKEFPTSKLMIFGMTPEADVIGLPNRATYYFQPEQNMIRGIYSQCDAWLFTSNSEGFGLPILESMACRTPVIGTRCGAAPDLLTSGGGILINTENLDELVLAMNKTIEMTAAEWLKASSSAYDEAQSHIWDDKASQFEYVLSKL